jgi:hypothetical protein
MELRCLSAVADTKAGLIGSTEGVVPRPRHLDRVAQVEGLVSVGEAGGNLTGWPSWSCWGGTDLGGNSEYSS